MSQFKNIATANILTPSNGTELLKGMKAANCLSSRKFCESLNHSHSVTLNRTCNKLLELFRFVQLADDYFNSWLYDYAYDRFIFKSAPHFSTLIKTESVYKFSDDHYLDSVYKVCGNITYETPRRYIDLCERLNNQTGFEYMEDELKAAQDQPNNKQLEDDEKEQLYEDTDNDSKGLLFLCESYDLNTARPSIVKMCKQFTEMSIETLDELSGNEKTYSQYQNDEELDQDLGYGGLDDYDSEHNGYDDGLSNNYNYIYNNDVNYLSTKKTNINTTSENLKVKNLFLTTAVPEITSKHYVLSEALLQTMKKLMAKYTDIGLNNICKSLNKYTPKNLSDFCIRFKKETNLPLIYVYHGLLNPDDKHFLL